LVLAANPTSLKLSTSAFTVPTTAKFPPSNLLSILNPVSLVELSVQVKFTWELDTNTPVKLLGAKGITVVVEAPLLLGLLEQLIKINTAEEIDKINFIL
jgi:hypothetical protein